MQYEAALAPLICMTKTIDGRTITGINRQLAATENVPAMKALHDELQNIKEVADICKVFLPSQLKTQLDADVNSAIDRVSTVLCPEQWPSEVTNGLLSRSITSIKASGNWRKYVEVCDPWACAADYDLKNLSIGTMRNLNESSRITVCSRVLIKEGLFAFMSKGAEASSHVVKVSREMLAIFDNYDALDMSPEGLPYIKEYTLIAECLAGLGDFSTGLRYKDFNMRVSVVFVFCF